MEYGIAAFITPDSSFELYFKDETTRDKVFERIKNSDFDVTHELGSEKLINWRNVFIVEKIVKE